MRTTPLLFLLACAEPLSSVPSPPAMCGHACDWGTVEDLIADAGVNLTSHPPGTYLGVSEGYVYVVDEADPDLHTIGGVGLRVLPQLGRLDVQAFGAIGEGQLATETLQRALDRRGTIWVSAGDYPTDAALRVHSDTTLHIGAGATIRHIDGVADNLIRNANADAGYDPALWTDTTVEASTAVGTEVEIGDHRYEVVEPGRAPFVNANGVHLIPALDHDIAIIGEGRRSLLDGNGIVNRDDTHDERWRFTGILFAGLEGFEVRDLAIHDTAMWGTSCEAGCRKGVFRDLHFEQPGPSNGGIANQDCVNLRAGSSDVLIDTLSGTCGDDVVALTALHPTWTPSSGYDYPDSFTELYTGYDLRGRDIEHVTIRNLGADAIGTHHMVRLLASDHNTVRDIHISDIHNTTTQEQTEGNLYGRRTMHSLILIGSKAYGGEPSPDETYIRNIRIHNVCGLARYVVVNEWSSSDVYMTDLCSMFDEADSTDGSGEDAHLIGYASGIDASHPLIARRHHLDGGSVLHDRQGDWLNAGTVVRLDADVQLHDSSFNNVYVHQARFLVNVEDRSSLRNVVFRGWDIDSLGQQAFRIKPSSDYRSNVVRVSNIHLFDRSRAYMADPAKAGLFWSNRNNFLLDPSVPAVTAADLMPGPVVGSMVWFGPGAGSFTQPTLAVANGRRWTALD